MSRVFWFAVGAGSGVYAIVKARRAVERFTPSGIKDQVGALGYGVQLFGADVRSGMAERETALRQHLGLPDPGHHPPALTAGRERGSS